MTELAPPPRDEAQRPTGPALGSGVGFGEVASGRSTRGTPLPARLLGQARSRIRALGILLASLGLVVLALIPLGILPFALLPSMGATVVVSLYLAAIASTHRIPTEIVLRLSLGGLVAYCAIFSFVVARARYVEYGVPGDATWTSVLLVAFPLLVPTRPRETLVALTLGALSGPAGTLWVAHVTDLTLTPAELIGYALSPITAAIIGYAGARFVYRLGLDVQRAEQLGSYRLVRRLGRGGMGEVWEARHARLARPAAIKFIGSIDDPSDGGSEQDVRRFEQEAALTATLRSPHTIEVFDFGVSRDGRFYYAMELLEGMDLHSLVRRTGPVPPARALHFTRQILESLAEAHTNGLIHRDIKPANIFICRYGLADDFVKVLDFGLARQIDRGDVERLTQDHAPRGTPAFMPPEAAQGDDVDARGDLYAVACLLWWMLTGRTVFDRPTFLSQLYAHSNETPEPASAHAPHPIPEALDALLHEGLAKNPADRPQSARDFIRRLEAIPVDKSWTDEQATTWWDQHDAAREADTADTGPTPSQRVPFPLAAPPTRTHDGRTGTQSIHDMPTQ